MTDRRSFVGWLGTLPAALRWPRAASATPPPPGTILRATPTVLYRQPDGRSNLVRVLVTGLDAPAARARVTDRRGTLVGTAGLLPEDAGPGLAGEVWVPLAEPAQYQIDLDVGKRRVFGPRVPPGPPACSRASAGWGTRPRSSRTCRDRRSRSRRCSRPAACATSRAA